VVLVIVAFVVFFALAIAAVLARGSRMRRPSDLGPPPGIPERRGGTGSGDVGA
jgi:hypothetical protein